MSYKAVSLFSGCGGFCEGVRLAGFDVLSAVENDRFAVETYRHNFPEVALFDDDIAHFMNENSSSWIERRSDFAALESVSVDLVFGGPPCQGYSQIGTRLLDDPRNQLYGEFVRILTLLRPRVFVMENVPNMLLLSKGVFKRLALEAFAEAGYSNCGVRVIPAMDHGVPQARERAIFIGVRDGLGFEYEIGEWMTTVLESISESRPTTVSQAIGDLPEAVSTDDSPLPYTKTRKRNPFLREMRLDRDGEIYASRYKRSQVGELLLHNHHTKEIQERRAALIALLKPGMKADSLPKEIWDGRRPEKWRRFHPDQPAHTLLAQMHRDLSEWIHPEYDRWITVREAARLQSFHDGFIFKSSEWQMLKQIGNAVPPLLAHAVATVAGRTLEHLDGGEVIEMLRAVSTKAMPLRLAV